MSSREAPSTIRQYYEHTCVRRAMLRYCGGAGDKPASAVFVAGLGRNGCPIPTWDHDAVRVAPADIGVLWDRECDIARSLWDTRHLLFLLELDYENADAPGEPFLHPADVFLKIEPAYRAARRVFARLGLRPQTIMTGRGYQFTGAISLENPLIDPLGALSPDVPPWHATIADRLPPGVTVAMSAWHARASAGLGLLIEYLAHLVMRESRRVSAIPVVVNGTTVGAGRTSREAVSIDFSHVGDPLDDRHFRVAYSTYQFHQLRPDIVGATAGHLPPLVALPCTRRSLLTALLRGRGLEMGIRLSSRRAVGLPDIATGVETLRRQYLGTPLAAFHRRFLDRDGNASADVNLDELPPCLAVVLDRPNDLLLKPEHIQHLVRGLMARGWDPRGIAALMQAKYEENHQWGDRWSRMHAATRAAFDVRVFAGSSRPGSTA